ncbi:MAG: ABC transporter permease subunit [Planctomycetes bacterium]|nr:ABC transporter permease subunit [Planctomycetota bacterium]
MTVQLLHYRAWQGAFRRPSWGVWPIARVALGSLLRRRLFWLLYAASLFLFLMFFFGGYLLDWAVTQVSQAPIKVGNVTLDTERLVRSMRQTLQVLSGNQDTFAYFFNFQGTMVMIVLALTGAVLVGNDFTFRSLPFYLSKPINRWHYILGKCLAVAVVVNLLTTLPALGLYMQHGMDEWEYFTNVAYFEESGMGRGPASWVLLLGVLGFGTILTVFLSVTLVAAASWMRRTMPLVMVWCAVFLFLHMVAVILVDGLRYNVHWRLLGLWNNLCLLGYACLGFDHETIWPAPQPSFLAAGITLGGVMLLCLTYLNQRTRAVEIVR